LLFFLFYFLILNLFFIESSHFYNTEVTRLAKFLFIYLIFFQFHSLILRLIGN
jgi:hypothetical protein